MESGRRIQNRYELAEPLGRGGMAEVWRALDERLRRPVAIKIIKPQLIDDPEFLVRFFSEAQAAAGVSHPNVTTILDFGQVDGRPYLVMEYVAGGPLTISEPFDPAAALSLVGQVAGAAGAAHAAGIVHRDIKPPNILLTDEGVAKLADFGIASSLGAERLTATGAAIGSPYYVSPEQVTSQEVTPASDVYSLGVVLYELLTGRRPFEGKRATAVAIARIKQDPVSPRTVSPALDPAIDALVMKCLARDFEDRFVDGLTLVEAIHDLSSGASSAPAALPVCAPAASTADEETQELGPPRGLPARRVVAGIVIVAALLAAAASGLLADDEATDRDGPNQRVEREVEGVPEDATGPRQR